MILSPAWGAAHRISGWSWSGTMGTLGNGQHSLYGAATHKSCYLKLLITWTIRLSLISCMLKPRHWRKYQVIFLRFGFMWKSQKMNAANVLTITISRESSLISKGSINDWCDVTRNKKCWNGSTHSLSCSLFKMLETCSSAPPWFTTQRFWAFYRRCFALNWILWSNNSSIP